MTPRIRAYRPEDRAACLVLFDANTPESFLPHERSEFEAWLDGEDGPGEYLVVEGSCGVEACGGVWFSQEMQRPAGFAWGMVHPERQRQGIGTLLARARLARLRALDYTQAALDTSQSTAPFYARLGFREVRRTPDGCGPGVDRVDMIAEL
ncbi:GNAT family N-acetyltransferase [Deinococcus humi]|uniref:GNAT superfamily N-acetyltransferase n=1 Tax=Deinococcus humi TaxID=662880 RepID=A0A7W8JXH1_9DEIO|nr:GNAT family N-acetyltransferase [Deinococcus humi]MBB5363753.1 GNAT superfamily N-acetyltransferase [Deinococcus humi]GGO32127.1 N-acetyltransferase [Deinococcus humi]